MSSSGNYFIFRKLVQPSFQQFSNAEKNEKRFTKKKVFQLFKFTLFAWMKKTPRMIFIYAIFFCRISNQLFYLRFTWGKFLPRKQIAKTKSMYPKNSFFVKVKHAHYFQKVQTEKISNSIKMLKRNRTTKMIFSK